MNKFNYSFKTIFFFYFFASCKTGYIFSKAKSISYLNLAPVNTIFPETKIKKTIFGSIIL